MKQIFSLKFSFVVLALICMSACISTKRSTAYWHDDPPGGIRIDTNLFYDETEMTNIGWREYMYWTSKIFGENSDEFKQALPDTLVWNKTDTCFLSYVEYYLRHPAYNDYPLVGVSQKQAKDYSKWRSDRVFERILVLRDKIKYDTAQNRETYFTIEKYYARKYQNVKPDSNFRYYPDYRLPTVSEWKRADSVDHLYGNYYPPRIGYALCLKNKDAGPEDVVGYHHKYRKKELFFDLHGNVSEWTSEKGITVGGGWADTANVILTQDTFHVDTANAWTGFRNVCEWKEWKMK